MSKLKEHIVFFIIEVEYKEGFLLIWWHLIHVKLNWLLA